MPLTSSVKLGFLVNPVAGMGGAVGLKGTDGTDVQDEAIRRGATRVSPRRAVEALRSLGPFEVKLVFLTCAGQMGEDELAEAGFRAEVVYSPPSVTTGKDSAAGAAELVKAGAELIVFAGGDGTARDVDGGVRDAVPIIGVPAGVKMHSAVFLNRPEDLGPVVSSFAADPATKPAEVMDIDEDLFRKGVVRARLYGMARTPDDRAHVQAGKSSASTMTAHDEARQIATYIADEMRKDVLYIVGPGSTTAAIGDAVGFRKTLLGVDAVKDGSVLKSDASEKDLLALLDRERAAKIIVSPIGAQGFFFGRGNQQISPKVIRTVGKENIIVVATPTKLAETPVLRTDTGDTEMDSMLKGRIKVVTGYGRRKLVEVS